MFECVSHLLPELSSLSTLFHAVIADVLPSFFKAVGMSGVKVDGLLSKSVKAECDL